METDSAHTPRRWFRHPWFKILTFIFLTPVWALIMWLDPNETRRMKIFAAVVICFGLAVSTLRYFGPDAVSERDSRQIAVPSFMKARNASHNEQWDKVRHTKSIIDGISLAIDQYEVDNGAYPPSFQSLITKGSESNWKGPYIKKGTIPQDPWGKEFIYSPKENGYELRSAGPNGVAGDADDVTN